MGCAVTKTLDENSSFIHAGAAAKQECCVFVPGLRLPGSLDLSLLQQQQQKTSPSLEQLITKLDDLHNRIVAAAECLAFPKRFRRKRSSNHGGGFGSSIYQLRDAIEEYLPVLLRLLRKEPELSERVLFTWSNRQDDKVKETAMHSAYYEVLSALQLLCVLCFLEANKALTFVLTLDSDSTLREGNKRLAMDTLLNAAQLMEFALKSILPYVSQMIRNKLPTDLGESVLRALQLQALGQTVEIQLELAIQHPKATMAVKRRLACEQVKYWEECQAREALQVELGSESVPKQLLFVRWKCAEAKAAAYYFHGMVLSDTSDKQGAAAARCASHRFLEASQKLHVEFDSTSPRSSSLLWGSMKFLREKLAKDAEGRRRAEEDEKVPSLPDFPLALQVDEYRVGDGDGANDDGSLAGV